MATTKTPISPKVTAAGLAAAFATLVMWGIDSASAGDIPSGVEAAITTIFTFGVAYFVPDRLREVGQEAISEVREGVDTEAHPEADPTHPDARPPYGD